MRVSCGDILAPRPTVVIMVKEPVAGRVKTRLGRDLGMVRAAWWFRHQSRALILRLAADRRWRVVLAVAPDTRINAPFWPPNIARMPQGTGDLGDRMGRILRDLPSGPVVVIGADIPGIRRAHIAAAFKALGDHQAVFGPAVDGGYWLMGLKRQKPAPKAMFSGVRWSTSHALSDTVKSLPGLSVALIDRLRDVDTAADLPPRHV